MLYCYPLQDLKHSRSHLKTYFYASSAAQAEAKEIVTKDLSAKKLLSTACSAPVCSDPSSLKFKSDIGDIKDLSDEAIANLVLQDTMKDHELERKLDPHRAVLVRRIAMDQKLSLLNLGGALEDLPVGPSLDYSRVHGANCEIVVGYVPLPVGIVGPLTLNGESVYVPMATTEGCLVASTQRGAKAISQGSGANAVIVRDGITRAPCVRMRSAMEAAELKL